SSRRRPCPSRPRAAGAREAGGPTRGRDSRAPRRVSTRDGRRAALACSFVHDAPPAARQPAAARTRDALARALRRGLGRMRYHVLATDYDGTIAQDGRVDDATVRALDDVRRSGRTLLLITGRRFEELVTVFPHVDLFEYVVAENGAVLHRRGTPAVRRLAD